MAPVLAARFSSPIARPGRRSWRRLPLRFLRQALQRRPRQFDFELPLVSLVDCLLCLLLFLLSLFGADATCPMHAAVPSADNGAALSEGPVVSVTAGQILVDGSPAGRVDVIVHGGRLTRVDELLRVLKTKRELWQQLNPGREFPGTVTLQVERGVPALAVKSVFQTAAFAGYPQIGFAIWRR